MPKGFVKLMRIYRFCGGSVQEPRLEINDLE